MNALILAAGYGTRMADLTNGRAKALLDVGGQPVIDYLMDQLSMIEGLSRIVVVTNGLYYREFVEWSQCVSCATVEVLSDGTCSNDERLGAIGDLQFGIERAGIDDDLLVAASDNLFRFPVSALVDFFHERGDDSIAVVREADPERLTRTSTLLLDENARVIDFAEKAPQPLSDLICPPLYVYRRGTLPLVRQYLDEGNNPDAPGSLVAWLHKRKPVYGKLMPQGRHDIGNPETYREAQEAVGGTGRPRT